MFKISEQNEFLKQYQSKIKSQIKTKDEEIKRLKNLINELTEELKKNKIDLESSDIKIRSLNEEMQRLKGNLTGEWAQLDEMLKLKEKDFNFLKQELENRIKKYRFYCLRK